MPDIKPENQQISPCSASLVSE